MRGPIPNEMGSARCRAMPALNQSADETRTPASQEEEEVLITSGNWRGKHNSLSRVAGA